MKKIATIALMLIALPNAALAEGDAKKGKKVFKKCRSCHSLEAGKNGIGPSLNGIIGKAAGTTEGYDNYSTALVESGITWSEEELRKFVTSPTEKIPGTKMSFGGLKREKDKDNLLAYLISNSHSE